MVAEQETHEVHYTSQTSTLLIPPADKSINPSSSGESSSRSHDICARGIHTPRPGILPCCAEQQRRRMRDGHDIKAGYLSCSAVCRHHSHYAREGFERWSSEEGASFPMLAAHSEFIPALPLTLPHDTHRPVLTNNFGLTSCMRDLFIACTVHQQRAPPDRGGEFLGRYPWMSSAPRSPEAALQ
jgi:hypothetical protein